jgi:hypothetical protein
MKRREREVNPDRENSVAALWVSASRVKRHPELTPWRHEELTPVVKPAMPAAAAFFFKAVAVAADREHVAVVQQTIQDGRRDDVGVSFCL